MKSLTCKLCSESVIGSSEQEVLSKMAAHMEEKHAEADATMKAATKDEQDKATSEMKQMISDVK